jgi:hypothetical protein
MSDRLLVGIPTRSNVDGLADLLAFMSREGLSSSTVVFDHGHDSEQGREVLAKAEADGVRVVKAATWAFYEMWNEARSMAYHGGCEAVALLNDDIRLPEGGLMAVCEQLAQHPEVGLLGFDYERKAAKGIARKIGLRVVSGTPRRGGVGGWAFMLRADLWPTTGPISEEYHIWYGDDELFCMVEDAGLSLAICEGVGVDHDTSVTLQAFPELLSKREQDLRLFIERWGSHRL